LLNPNFYDVADQFKATQNAARAIGVKLEILPIVAPPRRTSRPRLFDLQNCVRTP
jgi:hypothetical protein